MNPQDENRDTVNDLFPLHPSIKKFMYWVCAVVVVLVFMLVLLFGGLSRTLNSIQPAAELSNSMEPYEIELRSRHLNYKKLPESAPSIEWIIRLPRAFVVKEFGTNGAASDASNNFYGVHIYGVASQTKKTMQPTTVAHVKLVDKDFIGISLENSGSSPVLRTKDLCVSQDELDDIVQSAGGVGPLQSFQFCSNKSPRCRIETHFQGWGMSILVARDSVWYRYPKRACDFAKEFLQNYTIKIDALHTK